MTHEAKFFAGIIVGTVLFVGAIIYACNIGAGIGCRETAAVMGVPYRYSLMTDCMVKPAGRWVPLRSYRTLGES